jgi:DMSO/TMAO reductase YedYZ molybdopterin-dependent catalytic subunit
MGPTQVATEVADRVESMRSAAARRPVHDARTASVLGVAVGACFATCFATGVWSHLQQHPPGWLELPLGPTGLYRLTQGVHVATGLATIPLLLAKLFSVSPRLVERPVVRGPVHAMERLALLALVGGSVFLLVTGAANIARWYPWRFFFPVGHWWAAWLVLGATLTHLAFKVPVLRRSLGTSRAPGKEGRSERSAPGGLTRRGLLASVAAAAGLLTLATVGQTVPALRRTAWLAPRRGDIGPQGLPVNRTASAAGTEGLGDDATYRLRVRGPGAAAADFTLDDLAALPQRTVRLPIACVEGWSADADWTGVAVRDVMSAAGMSPAAAIVHSAQTRGGYRSSELSESAVQDDRCLLALAVNGEPLSPDHGAPVRLIAPNRPGVAQTKWVVEVEVA